MHTNSSPTITCDSPIPVFVYTSSVLSQSLKLLGSASEQEACGVLQLAAQVNFRLDKGQACAEAYDQLRAAGQVRAGPWARWLVARGEMNCKHPTAHHLVLVQWGEAAQGTCNC